jgi:preprotein translocase subunit SecE
MSSKTETTASKLDSVKLVFALLVILASIAGYYYFAEHSMLLRVVGIIAALIVAMGIAYTTDLGRNVWSFLHDAQIEVRKVVWPTRQETIQTTIAVIVMVVIVGTFLWLLDMFLSWAVHILTGQGG